MAFAARVVLLLLAALCAASAYDLTIKVRYPKANLFRSSTAELFIRGDNVGLNWNSGVQLRDDGGDQWSTTLSYGSFAANQKFEFKILVNDNRWQIGANEIMILPADDAELTVFPFFYTYEGKYEVTRDIAPRPDVKLLPRPLVIYTPPSYFENTYKTITDVLVMHDGENLFNDSTSFAGVAWNCQDTVNQLVVEGNMREIVIVGVYNTVDRIYEYTYSVDPDYGGGGGDVYLDYLEQSVYPWVLKNYRVVMDQPNLGILGSSLGGLISCYAGWTRAQTYSRGGCMSSSFWWNNEDFNNVILVNYSAPDNTKYEVYLDSGDSGSGNDDMDQTIRVRDHIQYLGYTMNVNEFYYLDKGGKHSEVYWGRRFYIPMEDFYPPIPHSDVVLA